MVTSTGHKSPRYVVFSTLVTLFILGPNIFLGNLFSNNLTVCSSLNIRDQVSHPHKTDKITGLFALMFIFLGQKTAAQNIL